MRRFLASASPLFLFVDKKYLFFQQFCKLLLLAEILFVSCTESSTYTITFGMNLHFYVFDLRNDLELLNAIFSHNFNE